MEKTARDKYKNNIEKKRKNKDVIKNKKIKEGASWEQYPTCMEIVLGGVPYDITEGAPKFGVNMEAGYHRLHTLGHDPILGWIFGTMNIITNTITLEDFRTYKIASKPRKHWESKTNVIEGFRMEIESIKEDKNRLPAAIFAQALHLKSDAYTKNGLPVPVLETFAPDFAGELYKHNYDSLCLMKDIAFIGIQAAISNLINMIISLVHGLYYDPSAYGSRNIYEVKTRKILMYSNAIATSSNVIWVAANVVAGDKSAVKQLDIGGLLVTINRLINDTEYIRLIKEEFIFGGFDKLIQGNELVLEEMKIWE